MPLSVVKHQDPQGGVVWAVCDDGSHVVFHVAGAFEVAAGDQLVWSGSSAHPVVTNLTRGRAILHMDSALYGLSEEAAAARCGNATCGNE